MLRVECWNIRTMGSKQRKFAGNGRIWGVEDSDRRMHYIIRQKTDNQHRGEVAIIMNAECAKS